MKEQIIISGFGGQGVLFIGKLLAYSGMMANKFVSWIPSYGPEMRGGTANCSVIISNKEITSPIVNKCSTLIALNEPSINKFMSNLLPGGKLIFNMSIIKKERLAENNIEWTPVPAQEIAEELGAPKLFNMVILGVYLKNSSILSYEDIKIGMEQMLSGKKTELIEANLKAIKKGMELNL